MEAYANALLIAIPSFMVLLLTEIAYGQWSGKQTYVFMDTIASLSSGLTNILKDTLGLVVILVSYSWLSAQLAITHIDAGLWLYIIAFICIDFASYWSHRLNHKINFFWNQHVIHHSSEEFNMACALRQSISNILGYGALFLIPAAILGIPEQVIAVLAPLHLFGQFWYHTQHIGKLGWLEYIIVTPSQHRVHHAINPIYIDKNLSAIFCVWDRMFGTFQEELKEEPPVYGVLKPVQSWNPIWINFQHLWGLLQDAWNTKNWEDKISLWFRPTGWRPKDVALSYPKSLITDVHQRDKYQPKATQSLQYWALFHLFATLSLLLLMLYHFESLNNNEIIVLGFALFAAIFGYTSVMDRYRWSYAFEWMRLLITFFTLSMALGVLVPSIYWAWMVYVAMASLSLGMLQWTGSTNNAQAA
ncbi:MAG: sterol desaturase family protein [Flavobacteriaceae bacterium]|jgi:sterol desaturase/sphingolipid hydroxylase (fatty acid hydroxylase superfamily)|nr:sterol desaturase family protein [Flavobacteriaceae bacterium]